MYNMGSSPALTNCTFSYNAANWGGGGIYSYGSSSPVLTNCILWGDAHLLIYNYDAGSLAVVTYSNVHGGYSGVSNIDADPLFVDAANGDYHLQPDSPCIDAGSNAAPNLPALDFEGDARVLEGNGDGTATVDMGVDEFLPAGPSPVEVEINIKPGDPENIISLSQPAVLVAVLATGEFDASTVNPDTVQFAGAAPLRWLMKDVDRDGDLDLLLYFLTRELALDESSTEATLTGETLDGTPIHGTDAVHVVP